MDQWVCVVDLINTNNILLQEHPSLAVVSPICIQYNIHVSASEVAKVILSLKQRKAIGPDKIAAAALVHSNRLHVLLGTVFDLISEHTLISEHPPFCAGEDYCQST